MKTTASVIYTVRTEVQPEHEEEFNEWQDTEHVPWIFAVEGYRSNQRFRSRDAEHRYMNLWEIDSLAAHDSPEKMKISRTPWGQRMRRFRMLRVSFYQQTALLHRAEEQENVFTRLACFVWNGDDTQWIRMQLLPLFSDRDELLGTRLFKLLRGEGEHLLLAYIREDGAVVRSLLEKAYELIEENAGTVEMEIYEPMGPAIYKS